MILFRLVLECMGLMRIISGVLCGKNFQGCTPGGIRLGVFLGTSIPFDTRARDLVVRLLVQLCLLFQISLRLSTLWIYPLKGLRSPGLEIRGQIVCQELIEPWHWWIRLIILGMCLGVLLGISISSDTQVRD